MQALVVEFRIKPEYVRDFEAAIEENARVSRETEPGCRQFDVCRDPTDSTLFFLYELYDDAAAIGAHLKSTHFLQMDQRSIAWVQSKVVRKLTRASP